MCIYCVSYSEWEKFDKWWKVGRYYDCLTESVRLLGDREMDYIGEGISFNLINLIDINDWKKVGNKKVYLKDPNTTHCHDNPTQSLTLSLKTTTGSEWASTLRRTKLTKTHCHTRSL